MLSINYVTIDLIFERPILSFTCHFVRQVINLYVSYTSVKMGKLIVPNFKMLGSIKQNITYKELTIILVHRKHSIHAYSTTVNIRPCPRN